MAGTGEPRADLSDVWLAFTTLCGLGALIYLIELVWREWLHTRLVHKTKARVHTPEVTEMWRLRTAERSMQATTMVCFSLAYFVDPFGSTAMFPLMMSRLLHWSIPMYCIALASFLASWAHVVQQHASHHHRLLYQRCSYVVFLFLTAELGLRIAQQVMASQDAPGGVASIVLFDRISMATVWMYIVTAAWPAVAIAWHKRRAASAVAPTTGSGAASTSSTAAAAAAAESSSGSAVPRRVSVMSRISARSHVARPSPRSAIQRHTKDPERLFRHAKATRAFALVGLAAMSLVLWTSNLAYQGTGLIVVPLSAHVLLCVSIYSIQLLEASLQAQYERDRRHAWHSRMSLASGFGRGTRASASIVSAMGSGSRGSGFINPGGRHSASPALTNIDEAHDHEVDMAAAADTPEMTVAS